jgi:hypothetical protein
MQPAPKLCINCLAYNFAEGRLYRCLYRPQYRVLIINSNHLCIAIWETKCKTWCHAFRKQNLEDWCIFWQDWQVRCAQPQCLLYLQVRLTFNNSTFCSHSVFMCFVWMSEQTAIISLYNINWLVCITETECVYCAVWTEYKCISRPFNKACCWP